MDLIQYLKTDDEMKNLRAKWKETFVTPFPPYNWDEYNGTPQPVGRWYFCAHF